MRSPERSDPVGSDNVRLVLCPLRQLLLQLVSQTDVFSSKEKGGLVSSTNFSKRKYNQF